MKKFLVLAATLLIMIMTFSCAMAAEDKVTGSVAGGKYETEDDSTTITVTGDVLSGKAERHANTGAFVKQKDDGTTSTAYGLDAGVSASGTLVKGTYDSKYGSENNNFKASASVEAGTVKASAGVTAGIIDGKLNAKVDVGAKAIAGQVDVSVGGTVAGVEGKVKGSLNVGVGANMKFDCSNGKVTIVAGGSLGLGVNVSVEIDVESIARKMVIMPEDPQPDMNVIACDPFAKECIMCEDDLLAACA